MDREFEYKLNPAYCIYKGVAIEGQSGSKISFAISDKKVKRTVKKGFYDFVEHVRCLSDCPPEYTRKASVKFKIKNQNDIEKMISSQVVGIYSKEQIEVIEGLCKEDDGLIVMATESESDNYKSMLHLNMEPNRKNDFVTENWCAEKKAAILDALNSNKLVFVDMKKNNTAEVLSELIKEDFLNEDEIKKKLKAIIIQDTHEYLEKEDLLVDIAVLKKKLPVKKISRMSEDEKDNCFVHYTNFGRVLKTGKERLFENEKKKVFAGVAGFALLFCMIFTSCNEFNESKRNREIKNDFINNCFGIKTSSLNDWQREHRKKWDLDYIGWSRADSFIVDKYVNKEKFPLYYGCWEKDKSCGEVYCRSSVNNIGLTEDFPPYRISGELDYSDLQLNFKYWFFNNNKKNIRAFTIVFYLFDAEGNPPVEFRNNVVINENHFVESYANVFRKVSLKKFFDTIPDEEYSLDYLYVSKIEFTDGTEWSDPFGMKYLN